MPGLDLYRHGHAGRQRDGPTVDENVHLDRLDDGGMDQVLDALRIAERNRVLQAGGGRLFRLPGVRLGDRVGGNTDNLVVQDAIAGERESSTLITA